VQPSAPVTVYLQSNNFVVHPSYSNIDDHIVGHPWRRRSIGKGNSFSNSLTLRIAGPRNFGQVSVAPASDAYAYSSRRPIGSAAVGGEYQPMNGQRTNGVAPVHSLPDRPALTKAELARAYWRAVSKVRRFKPKNVYNLTLVAYLEREFRAAWDDPPRRTRRVFELHS